MEFETWSEQETEQVGQALAKEARPGDIFCLEGDLGVGKTVFTRGFARGLGVTTPYITSPTFTIIHEYEGRLPLYHFDVYRVGSLEEMDDTGYEDYFFGQGVCLVEWAKLVKELIPPTAKWITIEKDFSRGDNYRRIRVEEGTK